MEEGELAADARRAFDGDLAAEQPCDFAADRQTESGSAVLASRRHVGLLERLEDDAQLVARNADAGVQNAKRKHWAAAVERVMLFLDADVQLDPPSCGEFERIRKQVLENLLQARCVRLKDRRNVVVDRNREFQ